MTNAEAATLPSIACAERGLRHLPLQRQFELLSQAGIRSVEIRIGSEIESDSVGHIPAEPSAEFISQLNSLRQQFNIQTPFVGIEANLTQENESTVSGALDGLLGTLGTASKIGANSANLRLTTTPTNEVSESIWKTFTSALDKISDAAEELGLAINLMTQGCVESQNCDDLFMVETVMTNRNILETLCSRLPKNVKIGFEPGMFKAVNPSDLRYAQDILRDHVGLCVLQDWEPRDRLIREATIGSDDLNYQPIIQKLSPDTPLLLSIPTHVEFEGALEKSIAYLNRILGPKT